MKNKQLSLPLTLSSIYIRRSNAALADGFNPSLSGTTMSGQFRMMPSVSPSVEVPLDDEKNRVTFTTRFEFRYTKIQSAELAAIVDEDVYATIAADISVEYFMDKSESPTNAEFAGWGESAGLSHAWPYWREFCHSTMSKMGLPVILVPLLNLQPPTSDEQKNFDARVEKELAARARPARKSSKVAR